MPRYFRRPLVASALALCLAGSAITASVTATDAANGTAAPDGLRHVLFVGNNWDGTADIIDPKRFTTIAHLNIVPDLQERMLEIATDPVKLGYFLAIRQLIGEGHDQLVDDMFSSHDGRVVYVSRPSLADVVGISLKTGKIVWRVPMEGHRADHMAISPDGTRLLVSDSTANKVQVIDPIRGKKVASFPSGDSPHESNYSKDGSRIFHASIGLVYTPADHPALDTTKGDRWFEVVDAKTYKVLTRFDIGKILAKYGHPHMSSAIRPMAIAPGEKTFYFQLSFLHGFVEFNLAKKKPLRILHLPLSEKAKQTPREQYLLDSAHHGLAINPSGTTLCAAATMSDYAALVDRKTFHYKRFNVGLKPYWATNSGDGKYCFVSASGDDQVAVLNYATKRLVAKIKVGDHPQRMRMGVIRASYLPSSPS
jgi:YVTN family beta-propeller protein